MAITISLDGSVALVTGAGAGIGQQIARWLARAGAAVAVNDIDGDRAAATVEGIVGEGGRAAAVVADVRDPSQAAALGDRVVGALGRLDVAVNNVGMTAGRRPRPFVDTPDDDGMAMIEQNLHATYRCCLAEARTLVDQGEGGVIVNVSSGETTRPARGLAAYGAAKAAINHLTITLASELGPSGIRVNAVAPGTIRTERVRQLAGEPGGPEYLGEIERRHPIGRLGEPAEVAAAILFLASDEASFVTGTVLPVDGGYLAQ